MVRILISGANRGIGLEFVRQWLGRADARIFATARRPRQADELLALEGPQLTVLPMDVSDPSSVRAAVAKVADSVDGLDLLVNNAAIKPPDFEQRLATLDPGSMLQTLQVNSLGPLLLAQACLPLLRRGDNPRLVNISSGMGSLTRKQSGGQYAYCSSKAALNMVTRGLAADLGPSGIIACSLHPGWVRTDMGGMQASLSTKESVRALLRVIDSLTPADNGGYLDPERNTIPW
ncbi:MAG: SDR family oxidoreductase [Anaerolineaceae bacterium]|nr:SDR family oxidoreductase [Anaerolineaceae bacterium]